MACRLLYGTHMVTIEVGAEKEHFVVHQSLLCTKSPYFDKALSGSFQEAITRFIRLPEISPVLFRIFVAWLYHGNLGYSPRIGKTIGEDFESLEITEEELQHEAAHQPKSQDVLNNDTESIDSDDVNPNKNVVTEPAYDITVAERSQQQTSSTSDINDGSLSIVELEYQEDDPRTWSYEVLVKLYVLADRFDIRELRADSLDALGHATQNKSALCHSMVVRYIYMNTPSGSKLRQYISSFWLLLWLPTEEGCRSSSVAIATTPLWRWRLCWDLMKMTRETRRKTLPLTRETCASTTNIPTKKNARLAVSVVRTLNLTTDEQSLYSKISVVCHR
jgi:hypothetical protein